MKNSQRGQLLQGEVFYALEDLLVFLGERLDGVDVAKIVLDLFGLGCFQLDTDEGLGGLLQL